MFNTTITAGTAVSANATTIVYPYTTATTTINATSTTGNVVYPQAPTHKRCRNCDHAHLNDKCIDFQEWGAITFIPCQCKEYAPKDNLEYLEYLYDKKQRKENSSSL